jgi:hypothetical protein
MEEDVDLLEHGFPSEDQVVEVVYCDTEITFENVLFEGVGFRKINAVYHYLENWDEDVSAGVEQIES